MNRIASRVEYLEVEARRREDVRVDNDQEGKPLQT
jgi:hypothetical protein